MRLSTVLSVGLAAGCGLAALGLQGLGIQGLGIQGLGLPAWGRPDGVAGLFSCPAGYTPQMPGGFWPAWLFGGSFGLMLVALVACGITGMMRNAPPRAPKPAKTPVHQPVPETMQPV